MKKVVCLATILGMVLSATVVLAQPTMKWRGSGGWGMGAPYGRMYDTNTVETIRGVVE
jgi:hypothetical protein